MRFFSGKNHGPINQKNVYKGFAWESRIPCSVLVHDSCRIEV